MTAFTNWRIDSADGLCRLTLDIPGASQNVLSGGVIAELDSALDEVERDAPNALLICSGKSRGFVAGADVREFTRIESSGQAREMLAAAHRVFDRLEKLKIPSIAVINGHCLGGGLELALACDYRVASDSNSIRIGLPEVLLGIHPGFGGSVRLIELIGAPAALNLMLSGRGIAPKSAQRLGLLDYAVPLRQLEGTARYLAAHPRRQKHFRAWRKNSWNKLLNTMPARSVLSALIRKKLSARVDPEHYPAPYQLLDLWRQHGGDRGAMLAAEQASVAQLIITPAARNLAKVFFLRENLKKSVANTSPEKTGARFSHVHVIGAGVMGGDIAAWCALRELHVTLHDNNPDALARATQRAAQLFRRHLKSRHLVRRALDRFQLDLAGDGARRADAIIEAIIEDRDAKAQVFAKVQKLARDDALLATNTSSIPLELLSAGLRAPRRLVGLHFFNPVAKMQLIEIVRGEQTDSDALSNAAALATRIGRLPLPVKSRPGFLVNRILMPYLLEAVALLDEGVPAARIDRAAEKFGMAMGPLALADSVGLDVCLHVARILLQNTGDDAPETLLKKIESGQHGKKSGQGFYKWVKGKAQKNKDDSDAHALAPIEERLVFRFLNESVACLNDGIVDSESLLDAGLIFGAGFAPFRGGPVHYIVEQGQDEMLHRLEGLHERYGERFAPHAGWRGLKLGG